MISTIAKDAALKLWGFRPGRDIKIAHLTNGMLRTVCGGVPKTPKLLGEMVATHAGRERLSANTRRSAAQLIGDPNFDGILLGDSAPDLLDDLRVALDSVLNQDGAFYAGSTSTLTLTHWHHLTNDPSDNGAGELVGQVLLADTDRSAAMALRDALSDASDATYRLTQPLLPNVPVQMPEMPPASALGDIVKASGPLQSLQLAFRNLAGHAPLVGKQELLTRAGRLAGLGLWVHLLNAGSNKRQPLLVCGPQPQSEIRSASHRGIALAQRQLRRNFGTAVFAELKASGMDDLSPAEYRAFADKLNEKHRDRYLLEFEQEIDAGLKAGEAACSALVTPALRSIGAENEGADKYVVALGRRLGLWPRYTGRAGHHLKPVAAVYDALVTALVKPGETMRYRDFWQKAAEEFGLMCGARGNADLEALALVGLRSLTPAQLASNSRSILQELSRQGYARTYADGEALISA
ncbi:hypothetical protein [Hymenobacter canadensis]|uniref:DUF1704 domain-containing protein n=1 Tax=Hymenobacter canadensis TaxID=2999067 RepID=A0ABY7LZ60_9BACT|nr:hypothetical protein [Hymenobacter canadensis]WBA44055.1 hypothetical protein O3303_21070 [Hymenobacter canadensis]